MPQVRAVATSVLMDVQSDLMVRTEPQALMIAMEIGRFLDRPAAEAPLPGTPDAPPGAPIGTPDRSWIGTPAQAWLEQAEPWCTWLEGGWR
jgi:hypothetical protein